MSRIIFISNSVYPSPNAGGGSIVLYRHLKRFENDGVRTIFINSIRNSPLDSEFDEINIKKRWWFPPLRKRLPILIEFRTWIYYKILIKKVSFKTNDIIISLLGDYTNLLALKISQKHKIPLFQIYHDDSLFNEFGKLNLLSRNQIQKIIKASKTIFVVSKPMQELLEQNGATQSIILRPIPKGNLTRSYAVWKNNYLTEFPIFYSGLIFEDLHTEILGKIGRAAISSKNSFTLVSSISKNFKSEIHFKCKEISIIDSFSKPDDILDFFYKNAGVLLVFYSFKLDKEHRMYTSFPSKFCEYSHLGIPILIIAPPESAIGKWAIENEWKAYINTDNEEVIADFLLKLKTQNFWEICSRQCIEVSQTQFNPDSIHKILRDAIL
jgi:hypothetical protein